MKNSIILLFLSSVILFSCAKSKSNLEAIPENAYSVTSINLTSLIKKLDFSTIKNMKSLKALNNEVKNENKKMSRLFDELAENPTKSGINFLSDIYLYTLNESRDEKFLCTSLAISNQEKFQELVEEIIDEMDIDYDLEEESEFSYILTNEFAISWDKNKAIIVSPMNRDSKENLEYEVENLMTLKENKQITQSNEFNTFLKNKKDLSFWMSSELFENESDFKEIEREIDIDLTDNFMSSHLDFQDGKVLLTTDFDFNESIKGLYSENNIVNNGVDKKLLQFLPNKYLSIFSTSINTKNIYNSLSEEEKFEDLEKKFEEMINISLQEFIENLKGNFVLNLYDIENIEYEVNGYYETYTKTRMAPIFGFVFDYTNDEVLYDIINQIPAKIIEDNDDYFEIKLRNSVPMYFALNDQRFIFSNDKKNVLDFKNNKISEDNLSDNDIADKMMSQSSFISLNLDVDNYSSSIKNEIFDKMNSREKEAFEPWEEFAKNINMSMIDENSFEISLNLTDDDENSLNSLINIMDKNYKTLTEL